jgi:hypothetical protein
MILNSKEDCAANISRALERTSLWRKAMTVRWRDDPRNMRAAKKLDQLALDAADLTESEWLMLQSHYSWTSEKWRNALNETARQVGFFHRAENISHFVKALVQNLSIHSSVVAA